jgi:flagellin
MGVESLKLQTNVASIKAQRNLIKSEKTLSTAMGRLSSGLRINTAADDAAGLAVSEKLRANVRGLAQAGRNANDGISMLQTAEGAMAEVGDMLIRMRELGVQAANGTLGNEERLALDNEFNELRSEIDRISNSTKFAGQNLLDGSMSQTFQVGVSNTGNDQIFVSMATVTTGVAGLNVATVGISTVADAQTSLANLDSAISTVSSRRGTMGAKQNRLLVTINNIAAMHENLSAANSRIRDADIASESANFTRGQILMQAGVSVLAQANQLPGMALSLIG